MTTAVESPYIQFEGKRVLVLVGAESEPAEARIEKAKAGAIIIKRKGKSSVELFTDDEVHSVELAPVEEKEVKARKLKPVELGGARQHLVDRHAYTVKSVNELTEQACFDFHEGIDHKADDLGHFHEAKDESKRDEAIANAEANSENSDDTDKEPEF